MANTPTSPASCERSHTLKAYLHKLHLPLPLRTASTTSTSSASVTDINTTTTSTPYPAPPTRSKCDDSILEQRIKLKLTGDAKPGSHSAYWGLTPDGQKHEPTYVDASEISRVVDFEDGTEMKKEKERKAVKKEKWKDVWKSNGECSDDYSSRSDLMRESVVCQERQAGGCKDK